jgi:CheY-like chemotaxis protein
VSKDSAQSTSQQQEATPFHILLVDDDLSILNLLKEVLSMVPGCQISTASNPADAMGHVVKGSVDVIFTDVHMPGVTGLELLEDIFALQQSPEVIVMTAYPSGEIATRAMELGATSLLAKPFEDIALVELELEKAIKRILRQRASRPAPPPVVPASELPVLEVPSAPKVVSTVPQETTKPKVSDSQPTPIAQVAPVPVREAVPAVPVSHVVRAAEPSSASHFSASHVSGRPMHSLSTEGLPDRKSYPVEILETLIEVEMPRSLRYNRPFAVGFIDIPENVQALLPSEQETYRRAQIVKIEKCLRRSDVLLDAGRDGVAVLLYECNRLGAGVVEHKLKTFGFQHTGFRVYPTESRGVNELSIEARKEVQNKRKFQIALLEPEEFFGRIVQNMLLDPKYHVNWVHSLEDAYKLVGREAESLRLLLMSMTKDPKQWELLLKFKKENLVQWPIVLFVDIPLTAELKKQLRALGVRAVVNKGISQEEFLYIVQSFVLPRPHIDERKNVRALVAVPTLYEGEGHIQQSSNTFTLSRDGLFIRDMNPPPSGTELRLKMYIPGQAEPLEAMAEVIYAVPYFVGVNRFHVSGFAAKFVNLEAAQKDRIERFVASCLTTYLI